MAEPDKLPEWATDEGDTIAEPSSALKATGWTAIAPSFKKQNWWQNKVYKWLEHFKSYLSVLATRTMVIETSDVTVEQSGVISYQRMGEYAKVTLPNISGTSNSTSLDLFTENALSLPAAILPEDEVHGIPGIAYDNGTLVPALITVNTNGFSFRCLPAVSDGSKLSFGDNFTSSGTKGFPAQTITYRASA